MRFGTVALPLLIGCSGSKGEDSNWAADDTVVCVPSAEVCNGVDDDCDGLIDNQTVWYEDADGDLYGNTAVSQVACEAPSGFVADGTDCDDTVAAVHPGVEESCNGVDDDCNGVIDDDAIDAVPWYLDADSDFYGDLAVTALACETPSGFVDDATDCDDEDAAVNPGAEEICDNGKDDDCDGQAEECRLSGTLDLGDVATEIGDENGAWDYRISLSGGCDVNGDGIDDLLVGVPDPMLMEEYNPTEGDPGAVFVVIGGAAMPSTLADAWSRISPEAYEDTGFDVSCAGDVTGDGHDDIWIGAPAAGGDGDYHGVVYLVTNAAEGETSITDAAASISGTETDSWAGQRIDAGSDLTGDGAPDVVFSESSYGSSSVALTRLRIFTATTVGTHGAEEASATIEVSTSPYIQAFDSHGDFDGDGIADVAMGTYTSGSTTGSVYVFSGPLSGSLPYTDADAEFDNAGDESAFTATAFDVAATGDLDGNGLDDLAVGYTQGGAGTGEGEVFVMSGPWSGVGHLADSVAHFSGEHADDAVGGCVAGAGDVDGDGAPDLLVTAPGYDFGSGRSNGAAYLFYGPLSGELSLAEGALLAGHTQNEVTGLECAGVGDLNGDGNADLAITAEGSFDFSLNRVASPGLVYFVPGGGF